MAEIKDRQILKDIAEGCEIPFVEGICIIKDGEFTANLLPPRYQDILPALKSAVQKILVSVAAGGPTRPVSLSISGSRFIIHRRGRLAVAVAVQEGGSQDDFAGKLEKILEKLSSQLSGDHGGSRSDEPEQQLEGNRSEQLIRVMTEKMNPLLDGIARGDRDTGLSTTGRAPLGMRRLEKTTAIPLTGVKQVVDIRFSTKKTDSDPADAVAIKPVPMVSPKGVTNKPPLDTLKTENIVFASRRDEASAPVAPRPDHVREEAPAERVFSVELIHDVLSKVLGDAQSSQMIKRETLRAGAPVDGNLLIKRDALDLLWSALSGRILDRAKRAALDLEYAEAVKKRSIS